MNDDSLRFLRLHVLLPAGIFLLAAIVIVAGGLDRRVSDAFFDVARGDFAYRGAFWAKTLIHRGGRLLVGGVLLVPLVVVLGGFVVRRWRPLRLAASYLVVASLLGPGLVAIGKATTPYPCPWDLARYGGERADVAWLGTSWAPPGHCFPGGHSSGAFSFFAFYFLARERSRRSGLAVLAFVVALGLVFSFGQWARGAHVPSHDLASAAVCWYAALGVYAGFRVARARSASFVAAPLVPAKDPG